VFEDDEQPRRLDGQSGLIAENTGAGGFFEIGADKDGGISGEICREKREIIKRWLLD
jgi:hypothetical protein